LLLPDRGARSASRKTLELCLAGTNVRIEAPPGVLSVLDATLSFVPRYETNGEAEIVIAVHSKDDAWEIQGLPGSFKALGTQSALPQIAGAVVMSAVHAVAANRKLKTMRASVIERDGRALAMVGDDWDSAITLAAHLHGRGWSFVGSDNVLLDPETLEVFPIQKSLYVNSSSVTHFPMEYRRAVEASPWYVTPQGISFYAVDPHFAGHRQTWASATLLQGIIIVDGTMMDRPSLESVDENRLQSESLSRLGVDWTRVGVVNLHLGAFADTCDLVEHWFESTRK
jgi:hypothetical protein